jgi:hypothetical protein
MRSSAMPPPIQGLLAASLIQIQRPLVGPADMTNRPSKVHIAGVVVLL